MEVPVAIVNAGHEVNGLDIIFFGRESIALTKPQPLVAGLVVTQEQQVMRVLIDPNRRNALRVGSAAVCAFFLRAVSTSGQSADRLEDPQAPSARRDRDDADPPVPAAATKKALLEQRQKDIKKDIEKLFDLATQLKAEVEKTDATTTLSLAMVRRAEEIEKLARQIKDYAKG